MPRTKSKPFSRLCKQYGIGTAKLNTLLIGFIESEELADAAEHHIREQYGETVEDDDDDAELDGEEYED